MYKQIIILLLFVFVSCASRGKQHTEEQHTEEEWLWNPTIFFNGQAIARRSDYADCDMPIDKEDRLYIVDTINILSQKITVHIPVSLRGLNRDTCIFAPNWSVHITNEKEKSATLDFWSSLSGDFYRLEIKKENSQLYVSEELMFWMRSTYRFHSALQILRRKVHIPINGVIVFDDFFDIKNNNFESFHCPTKYPEEDCLEMFRRGHKFTIDDFKEE